MGLSCSCDDFDLDGDSWIYYHPADFSTLSTPTRRRCCSCKQPIDIGADCVEFHRVRGTRGEYEERRFGEGAEIELASWWMCDDCGGLYFSLLELGYCITLGDDMRKPAREYAAEKWIERHEKQLSTLVDQFVDGWPKPRHSATVKHSARQIVVDMIRSMDPPSGVSATDAANRITWGLYRDNKRCTNHCAYCQKYLGSTHVSAAGGVLFHSQCLSISGYIDG